MNIDFQTLINLGSGLAMSVAGWFARRMWDAMDTLKEDLSKLREELPKTYITKNDFKDGIDELKRMLIAIDTKLDRKSDKP